MNSITKLVFLTFIFLSANLTAQKTMIFKDQYRVYRTAQGLYDKENFSAAQDKFKEVIQSISNKQDEIRIEAEYYYAVCALELFHKDAEFLLERFVVEHPDNIKAKTVYFQLGNYNYRLKKSKKVLEYFNKVDPYDLSKDEKTEFYFKKGYSEFKLDDYEHAQLDFREIIDIESEYQVPAIYYYSHIAYTENNYQTALEGFQKIASNEMFRPIVPYYITQIYYKQKRYKQLTDYAPAYIDSISSKRKQEFSKLIGDAYYNQELYAEAIPYLKQARGSGNIGRDDNYSLGYAYYRTKDYANAVKYLQRAATKKDALSQIVYYHMADAYLKLNKKDYALNAFRDASKLDFDSEIKENALFNYAKLAYELSYNPYDEAIKAFQEYIEKYPNSPHVQDAYEFLIKVYMTTKNYDDALASIEKIKNKDNRMKMAYQTICFNRGVELFHNGNYNEAIQRFTDVDRYPINKEINAESIFWKGECFYKLEDYNQAIEQYINFRLEPGAAVTPVFHDADYSVAYAYFMKAQPFKMEGQAVISDQDRISALKSSTTAFRNFIQLENRVSDKHKLQDAYLRLADCYYLLDEKNQAIDAYTLAIQKGEGDLSYAYYQKAKTQGLIKDYNGKAETLKELTEKYPNSSYQVLSIKDLAMTYQEQGNHQKAIETYQKFIKDYPQNKYVPEAYTNIGQIYLSQRDYTNARKYFQKVLDDYPNATTENQSAISLMKEVYVGENNLEGYFDWLKSQGIEVAQTELDSTLWDAIDVAWNSGECEAIQEKVPNYLSKIDKPVHETNAHFYWAQCLYLNEKLNDALEHYRFVIERVNNDHYEEALRHAADISYKLGLYKEAEGNFATLEKVAVNNDNIRSSIIGQMNCYWETQNYQSAVTYADKVLELTPLDDNLKTSALYIKGLSQKEMGMLDNALETLSTCSKSTKSIKGAEAKYNVAEILFEQKQHEACENELMELVQQKPSYDYWIAKAIILLGDNFTAVGDYFNAKHSLQSVVDNYDGPEQAEIVKIAQEKLDAIAELENNQQKSATTGDVEINFDSGREKNEELFDENIDNDTINNKK